MKTWKIPVFWTMNGTVEIKADTLEEAICNAKFSDNPLPEGDYLDGSFDVDEYFDAEDIRKLYNDGQEDEKEEEILKIYDVEISVIEEYTGYTTIQARNEEEAKEKATDKYFADEIEMSFTNMEGIKNIKVSEIKEEK